MEISPPFSVLIVAAENVPPPLTVSELPLVWTVTAPPAINVPPEFTVMPPLLLI